MTVLVESTTTAVLSKHEFTAESRSTSAGSRESGQVLQPNAKYSTSSLKAVMPEYVYPVPVIVRNTFLDTQDTRSVSLEEFFEERRIHSCPVAPPEYSLSEDGVETPELPLQDTITTGAHALLTKFAAATGFWTATPTGSEYDSSFQHGEPFNIPEEMPRVLMLAEALPEPALGSSELPTVGSAAHYVGSCKPCAFLYTKGCGNGLDCPFCHLCPPDEKRRRQKDKQAAFREMRRQRRQVRV